ncbi:LysR substrate-binding domain-containing protein, partial [Sulfitobacter sp. HI0040]
EGREGRFTDIADALTTGRMDVAISYDVGFAGKFRRRRLRQVSPVAFLSTDHPLATETRLELTDLIDRSV